MLFFIFLSPLTNRVIQRILIYKCIKCVISVVGGGRLCAAKKLATHHFKQLNQTRYKLHFPTNETNLYSWSIVDDVIGPGGGKNLLTILSISISVKQIRLISSRYESWIQLSVIGFTSDSARPQPTNIFISPLTTNPFVFCLCSGDGCWVWHWHKSSIFASGHSAVPFS